MKRRLGWTLLTGMLLVAAGCATGQGPVGTTTSSPPTTAARGAPSGGRIIVVVEENHSFDQVIGAAQAPFLNRLAGQARC